MPLDDPATFALIQSTRTLGMFQIESPGQRELVGKFGPETFGDLITDISLFRPGPVKSDMVTPFLQARQGWAEPEYLHEDLRYALEETCGVVVFHEQVLEIVATFTGVTLAEADEVRRAMGSPDGQEEVEVWLRPRAFARGYDVPTVDKVWAVLKAFASFGFCKAHAAAFALPTYQSAWLKAHHPAAFLAGVLTHDPGMYPKRLILDDARQFGIDGAAAGRQPVRGHLPGRAGGGGVRHPAGARGGEGHLRGGGGPGGGRPALRLAGRLLAPGRGGPPGGRAAGAHRRLRRALRAGVGGHRPVRPAGPADPPRPAAAGGRAGPVVPGGVPRCPRGHPVPAYDGGGPVPTTEREAQVALAATSGESLTTVQRPDVRTLAARQSQAAGRWWPRRCSWPSTSATRPGRSSPAGCRR